MLRQAASWATDGRTTRIPALRSPIRRAPGDVGVPSAQLPAVRYSERVLEPQRPRRRTGWNTYTPWLLALTTTIAGFSLIVCVISWIPFEPVPGLPPSTLDGPYVPGGLAILCGVVVGRQIYLRLHRESSMAEDIPSHLASEASLPPASAGTVSIDEGTRPADEPAMTTHAWRTVALTGGAILTLASILLTVGFGNGYSARVVDQEAQAAATYRDFTGSYSVVDSGSALCTSGDDYYACVEMHRTLYNSVCTEQALNMVGRSTCESLSDFVTDAQARYAGCGYGCRTAGDGKWGWNLLHLEADYITTKVPALREISHEERCDFDLGIITFGQCPGRAS